MRTTLDVIKACSRVTGVPASQIVTPARTARHFETRIAIAIVALRIGRRTMQISRAIARDHSTIAKNLKKHGSRESIVLLASAIEAEMAAREKMMEDASNARLAPPLPR